MKILLDTNIVLDLLDPDRKHSEASVLMVQEVEKLITDPVLCISVDSLSTIVQRRIRAR